MSDAWEEIQAVKSKRNSLREKLEKRKKERQNILSANLVPAEKSEGSPGGGKERSAASPSTLKNEAAPATTEKPKVVPSASLEVRLLQVLSDMQLQLPATASALLPGLGDVDAGIVASLLQKFATQKLITIKERTESTTDASIEVESAESVRLAAVLAALMEEQSTGNKRKGDSTTEETANPKVSKTATDEKKTAKNDTDIMSLLAMPSSREKAVKRVGEEIMDLLSKPTAKEKSLADKFKSQGGAQVMEFCPAGTRGECSRAAGAGAGPCRKLHFKKIIQPHTDEALGDCSFLNTCFHMDSCKYVHYEVDNTDPNANAPKPEAAPKGAHNGTPAAPKVDGVLTLTPPQWLQCDLRYLDMTFLGKFAVIMADPPWDIHMELPYGTMSDDEMRCLGVPQLQDQGLIFLWVTGRAMELGRECLKLWGYERVDELIWVKTNQLQRIIRTGRTGHWLNHGKEHCLVGMKGNPENLNRGLDCDVIVAEVRATSHKPDEIYGIIERLSPGTRKIELFGRPHNVQPNWITLGNQVDGVRLVDPDLIAAFKKRYPDGNCMAPPPPDPGLA
ncbi:N6-adenosine-methyltransferase catalytic subunit-like isoform X1 [Trichoplusia ni]|uniref:mRNA m(6)A methyltransferase n=2 Tax=Obtectomera TaxID=104431 RepID=A0A7E5VIR5_TRINI|nr:N6-adenosine-methyltransferase catalytic subunit-like isoform X1 [Trichoplusia ni]XP_026746198.1 N6-adenosine-methyltransferase catalytic subunit-like isoform X1 [Trichoplusia ni]